MVWNWDNPIGLGLFFMMCTASVIGLTFAVWLMSRVAAAVAPARRNGRR